MSYQVGRDYLSVTWPPDVSSRNLVRADASEWPRGLSDGSLDEQKLITEAFRAQVGDPRDDNDYLMAQFPGKKVVHQRERDNLLAQIDALRKDNLKLNEHIASLNAKAAVSQKQ